MIRGRGRYRLLVSLLAVAAVVAMVAGLALRRIPADGASAATLEQPGTAVSAGPVARPRPSAASRDCYVGVVVADAQVDVSSRIEGSVQAIAVAVGDAVEAGQVLARLDSDLLRHELASARASSAATGADGRDAALRVELAEATYRRKESLADLLSREQIEESRYELESAKLRLEAAQARVRQAEARIEELEETASQARVVAPFDGVVGAVYLEPGAVVARGAGLVRLMGTEGRIRFALPPDLAGAVRKGTVVGVWADQLDRETVATVSNLAPEIDPESQMVFAEAKLDPEGGRGPRLPVGAVVRVAPRAGGAPCRTPR